MRGAPVRIHHHQRADGVVVPRPDERELRPVRRVVARNVARLGEPPQGGPIRRPDCVDTGPSRYRNHPIPRTPSSRSTPTPRTRGATNGPVHRTARIRCRPRRRSRRPAPPRRSSRRPRATIRLVRAAAPRSLDRGRTMFRPTRPRPSGSGRPHPARAHGRPGSSASAPPAGRSAPRSAWSRNRRTHTPWRPATRSRVRTTSLGGSNVDAWRTPSWKRGPIGLVEFRFG